MKFGEPTPDRTVTADGYMVGGAIMAPPPGKIGLMMKISAFLQKVGILFKIALNQDWHSIHLLCFTNAVSDNNKQPLHYQSVLS